VPRGADPLADKMNVCIEPLAWHQALVSMVASWHFGEWGHADPDGSESIWAERLADRARPDGVPSYYVAFVDGTPTGSVGLCESDMSTHLELSPWLSGLYVLPQYRQRGVGGLLVLHALDAARRSGARALFLHTAGAERLYVRLGWQCLAREFYEGEEVSVMSNRLVG
jgi:GNAT superfamily N-acetyltransferase